MKAAAAGGAYGADLKTRSRGSRSLLRDKCFAKLESVSYVTREAGATRGEREISREEGGRENDAANRDKREEE